MLAIEMKCEPRGPSWRSWTALGVLLGLSLSTIGARALPAFARQTGQNCVACHVGGQFPELTAYGRQFKLTAYTLGQSKLPLSVMGVLGYAKTSNTSAGGVDPTQNFNQDGTPVFQAGSIFLAGRITNNLGVMGQWTYNAYPDGGANGGIPHSNVDNSELRFADRFVGSSDDVVVGAFLNNNPSMQDVWNSTPAWGYPYVVSSFTVKPPSSPLLAGGLAQRTVGAGAYAWWDRKLYGEMSFYGNARGPVSFLRAGPLDHRFSKPAPYWRLTWSQDWGAHNLMVGTSGLVATLYNDPQDTTSSTNKFRDLGLDAQYQYVLDPHAVSVHLSWIHEKQYWGSDQVAAGLNPQDTFKQFMLKGAYTYHAKYGGSLAYLRGSGSTDPGQYASTDPLGGNVNGSPNYAVWIPELYWMPVQYARVGLQLWRYTEFNGGKSDYTGMGRSAKDNDSVFIYVWAAY